MSNGIDIGDAAMRLLDQSIVSAYPPNGPNIAQATARLDHLKGTNLDMREAIAYLALQVTAYRRIANEDAHLALLNVAHIVDEYKGRRAAVVGGESE